ncbi:MAG: TonB family protein [Chthonomonadales bacterium]|nr:TonB family protein [Chthonomonadales bacterium]
MRRRRQKNPLLGRIIGISILAHIIALPILAHFGAFKKIQEHFVQTQMVVLPPPEVVKEKPVEKKETKARKTAVANKSKSAGHSQAHAGHSNVPQPHIAVAQGDKSGDGGPAVEEGNGKVGVVPEDPNARKPETAKAENTTPVEKEPVKPVVPEVKQPEKPLVTAPVKPVEAPKTPVVTAPIVPKAPVFTAAQPLDSSQPKPSIPDDLRSDAIDKTVVIEFTVGEDGAPMAVKAVQSTGNDELDRRALDAARKWRFKPATRDGQPVVGRVRLSIEFQVS